MKVNRKVNCELSKVNTTCADTAANHGNGSNIGQRSGISRRVRQHGHPRKKGYKVTFGVLRRFSSEKREKKSYKKGYVTFSKVTTNRSVSHGPS